MICRQGLVEAAVPVLALVEAAVLALVLVEAAVLVPVLGEEVYIEAVEYIVALV